MKNTMRCFALCLLSFVFSLTCNAKEIAGMPVPESLTLDTLAFKLQGAGMRDKFFMDLYIASLYATESYSNASELVEADKPMVINLHILSSLITSEKMEEATKEGFINATQGNIAPLQAHIDTFIQTFKEPISVHDHYEFFYLPSKGVRISKNGIYKTTLESLAFKKALFGIWLGNKPAQESLKKELMGK